MTESERVWWGGGTGMPSGTTWVSPAAGKSGSVSSDGHTFHYTCRGPSLVHFDKT